MSGRPPRRPNPPQGGSSAPSGPDRPPGTRPPAGGSPADSVTRPSRPPAGGSDGGTGTGIQNPGVRNTGRLAGIGTVVGGLGLAAGSVAGLVFGLRGADTIDNIVESVTEIVQNPYFLAVAGGIVVVFVMRKK